MAVIESQGTVLRVGDGEEVETFLEIGEVVTVSGPGGSATVIPVSNLSSTRVEKIMGLADEGQLSLGVHYDTGDAGQNRLKQARAARERANFEIILSDGGTLTFSGFVLEFSIELAVDQVVTGQVTIEIDGELQETIPS